MTPPQVTKPSSPVKMMLPLAAFILIAAAWSGFWFYARSEARTRLATFEADTLALNCAEREWGGYPFRISLDCRSPRVDVDGTTVTATNLRLIIQAWNPNHMLGAIFGPVTIGKATVTGDTIRFSHRMSEGELALASLVAENQTVTVPNGQALTISKLEAHARPDAQPASWQIASTATNFAMDDLRMDSFKLDGTIPAGSLKGGDLELMTEASDYLDAIWLVTRLANLGEKDIEGVEVILTPLLRQNNNKLPLQRKDGTWYWGPFQLGNR